MAMTGSGTRRRGRELKPIVYGLVVIGYESAPSHRFVLLQHLYDCCKHHPRGVAGIAEEIGGNARTIRRYLSGENTKRAKLKEGQADKLMAYYRNLVQPAGATRGPYADTR